MKKWLLFFLISIQLIIISFLSYKIYQKHKNLLGVVSINPIKKQNIQITPKKNLKYFFEPKANTTISEKPSWLPYKAVYTINSDSLNERYEYSIEKPAGAFRIITLGDSFTFGSYVSTKDNWTELLENKLNSELKCKNINKFEVINLGVKGYDIQYSVERFKLRGRKYNPDLVLWFLKGDDFQQIYELLKEKVQKIEKEEKIDKNSVDFYFKGDVAYPSYTKATRQLEKELGKKKLLMLQARYLNMINKYYNGPLVIFTFSSESKTYKDLIKKFNKERRNGYFFDGIVNLYNPSIKKLFTFPDRHPNQKGHKIIAENVFNYLTKNKIIPCN